MRMMGLMKMKTKNKTKKRTNKRTKAKTTPKGKKGNGWAPTEGRYLSVFGFRMTETSNQKKDTLHLPSDDDTGRELRFGSWTIRPVKEEAKAI
jgi:hypothetical protein